MFEPNQILLETGLVRSPAGRASLVGSANAIRSTARFSNPNGVAVDSAGNLYVADFYFNTIRQGYPSPKILNSAFVGGQFRFDLTAPPARSVIVEGSPAFCEFSPQTHHSLAL
jgi:DNA-binding beta-propeller fold protein YncE